MSMPERSLSPQRLAYLRAQKRRRRVVLALQVLLLAAFLGWWELAARCGWVDAFIVSVSLPEQRIVADWGLDY